MCSAFKWIIDYFSLKQDPALWSKLFMIRINKLSSDAHLKSDLMKYGIDGLLQKRPISPQQHPFYHYK